MRRFLTLIAIITSLALPAQAFAAVAFGAIDTVNTLQTYTSQAVTGSNTIGLVYVDGDSTGDNITATTWGGVSMTKVIAKQVPGDRWTSVWCVTNPTSAGTIAFTGASSWRSVDLYYTGAAQTCPPDSSRANTSSTNVAISASTTVVASSAWFVMFQKDNQGGKTYTLSGSASASRLDADAGGLEIADSNTTVATGIITGTMTEAAAGNHAAIAISIAPAAAVVATGGTRITFSGDW